MPLLLPHCKHVAVGCIIFLAYYYIRVTTVAGCEGREREVLCGIKFYERKSIYGISSWFKLQVEKEMERERENVVVVVVALGTSESFLDTERKRGWLAIHLL